MCAKPYVASANESSKGVTMFQSTTFGGDSLEAFNTCSTITRR
jgi:hypothetical protein